MSNAVAKSYRPQIAGAAAQVRGASRRRLQGSQTAVPRIQPPSRPYRNRYKRVVDVSATILAAPFALAIVAIAGALIVLTMGRPIFFMQPRVGRDGRIFNMLKLRTMTQSNNRKPDTTAVNDRRVTPLGRYLRRYRIDEIPQFLNVLRGDMSIIGPRPEQPQLDQAYRREIPGYRERSDVLPGITGWAQVCYGYAGNTDETRQKLTYDLQYVRNLSLRFDIRIALRTVGTILLGRSVR